MASVKRITISIPEWVTQEIIGRPENLSQRITELVIKGRMSELNRENIKTDKGTDNYSTGLKRTLIDSFREQALT